MNAEQWTWAWLHKHPNWFLRSAEQIGLLSPTREVAHEILAYRLCMELSL